MIKPTDFPGYSLPAHCLNKLQIESITKLLKLAPHAHMIDIFVRHNGKTEVFQADWVKYMTAVDGEAK